MKMEVSDIQLFMKYALPCAETLVQRGSVDQKTVDNLINIVKESGKIPKGSEKIFRVALAMCTVIARRTGKENIDSDVIRQYFLMEHDKAVDERYSLMGDFDPEECRICTGIVESIKDDDAIVDTKAGKKRCRNDIAKAAVNDHVIVHRGFIVEKLDLAEERKWITIKR